MQCQNMQSLGGNRSGGFAQYTVAPETNVFPIGDLSFAAAAFTEPLACVVWGIKRMQVQPGDSVLLFGAGPTGCLMLQTLRRSGAARVVVTEQVPWRLKRAAELGAAETVPAGERQNSQLKALAPPGGYDLIVDASGNPAGVRAGV